MSEQNVTSIDDVQAYINENEQIHIAGNGTKTALACIAPDVPTLTMKGLSGIIEYQPEEYTFTAYAGTPVHEIQSALAENHQYLPCDPLIATAGATLGGTVATNLGGSRRYRYGGIRDFILGVRVVDGLGQTFRCGGKVVKNSAGFDLAKFFVGSLGRYAVLTEVTFKVFPEPTDFATVCFHYASLEDTLSAIYYLNQQAFEFDALDIEPLDDQWRILTRFGGSVSTLSARIDRFVSHLKSQTALLTHEIVADEIDFWSQVNQLAWAGRLANIIKIPISPRQIPMLEDVLKPFTRMRRYGVGGNIAWIATDDNGDLSIQLEMLQLTGLQFIGQTGSPILGKPLEAVFSQRVKNILDPQHKFV